MSPLPVQGCVEETLNTLLEAFFSHASLKLGTPVQWLVKPRASWDQYADFSLERRLWIAV